MNNAGVTWLAQLVEHETLNLRVMGSSPTLGEYSLEMNNTKVKL